MGVQEIYQTIGPKVLGKTKVFYCLIYLLGIGNVSRSSNPETCSMRPKLVNKEWVQYINNVAATTDYI